ncbi:hypothetical protein HU200_016889 [Digitaria exilis]|uniref:Disease resistance R13L4/SHOC-2-like LRR domain-containing protein n=1 Tax=Digitaria exilis TaxID=1010633 RepID=A0A835F861_9POAL|nr:hypothetical protein HU200_016889 [Digitaria exilis]
MQDAEAAADSGSCHDHHTADAEGGTSHAKLEDWELVSKQDDELTKEEAEHRHRAESRDIRRKRNTLLPLPALPAAAILGYALADRRPCDGVEVSAELDEEKAKEDVGKEDQEDEEEDEEKVKEDDEGKEEDGRKKKNDDERNKDNDEEGECGSACKDLKPGMDEEGQKLKLKEERANRNALLLLTWLLVMAMPVMTWRSINNNNNPELIFWRLSPLLCSCCFIWSRLLDAAAMSVHNMLLTFTSGFFLALYVDAKGEQRMGALIAHLNSHLAAGMLGYALAERRQRDGVEVAAARAASGDLSDESTANGVLFFQTLTSMNMRNLPSCDNLPPLGLLPNLKNLSIIQMQMIKKVDVHLYGGSRAFPRLVNFTIVDMKCLEEWNTEDGLNEPAFPCLSSVEIKCCPRLRIKPHLPRSINTLKVHSSDKVMLSSRRNNRGLVAASAVTSLHVERCMVPLHHWSLLRHLPSLKHLEITKCSDITCSSLTDFVQGLTSLRTPTVRSSFVPVLTLPEGVDLTSLMELKITDYKFVNVLPDLKYLTRLELNFCTCIKTLPDSIQLLTCLQTLTVRYCKSIVSLPEWLGDLTSLMKLEISYCERIEILPDSIQKLTRLETLIVEGCKRMHSLPERLGIWETSPP